MNQRYGDTGAMRLGAVLRIARLTLRIAASFIFLVMVAGFGTSVAWAEDAATDQTAPANPALADAACPGGPGQQGVAPAPEAAEGSTPPVLGDGIMGSVHGQGHC